MKRWNLNNNYTITQVLAGRSNAYLIVTPQGNILVDTGRVNYFEKLIDNIAFALQSPPSIQWLVLTHTHFDHCENAQMINDFFDTTLYVGCVEARYLRKGYTPIPRGTNLITKGISFIGNRLGRFHFQYNPAMADYEVTRPLKINDLDIQLLPTPGHSVGSLSVIVNDEIALVGDSMYHIFPKKFFPPFADDPKMLIRSWRKLLETKCQIFLPGHGNEIKRADLEAELSRYEKRFKLI